MRLSNNLDDEGISQNREGINPLRVIPAKAGIQWSPLILDSRLRGSDGLDTSLPLISAKTASFRTASRPPSKGGERVGIF